MNVIEEKNLFSEVTQKGDEVRMYGKLWYVMEIEDGIVKLISKDCTMAVSKHFEEENKKFCRKLHRFAQKCVEEMSNGRKLLHTEVRSCRKGDLNKYLNRKVKLGNDITDRVWSVSYSYWLASPYPSNARIVWYMYFSSFVGRSIGNTFGVRPVVYLKSDICTSGKNGNGVWVLEE